MQPFIILKNAITLILLLIGSWITIHLFALFGVFLVIAIPIFQLMFYPKILCFWCQIKRTPHTLGHAVIDSSLILVATIFSLALVYGETKLFTFFGFPLTQKSAQFIIPDQNSYKIGEIFPMKIDIQGIKVPINIVRADVQFDPTIVEVASISTDNSFANIFIQKDWNNDLGYARLTGGLPSPGFKGASGTFGTIYFKGKQSGPIEISFLPTSEVLANDGKGTNVLISLAKATYYITPDKITPEQSLLQETRLKETKSVLGANSSSLGQLVFTGYADPLPELPRVLGASTAMAETKTTTENPFLRMLCTIDQWIVDFWTKVGQSLHLWR